MSQPPTLVLEPLTPEAFAPFGEVISAGRFRAGAVANQGTAMRFDYAAQLFSDRPGARPNLCVFEASLQPLPLEVTVIERHPHSSQVFLPLRCARYLICVAPTAPDGGPDLAGLRAFECRTGEGINYRVATWHHPIVALDARAELVMLAWEDGGPGDCELRRLASPIRIVERGPGN